MTGAQLQVVLDRLGLGARETAELLSVGARTVTQRTVRRWVTEASPVPAGVQAEIEELAAFTDATVGELVAVLRDQEDPVAWIYRGDRARDLHVDRPETARLPVRWWTMVTARALEVLGVQVPVHYHPRRDEEGESRE